MERQLRHGPELLGTLDVCLDDRWQQHWFVFVALAVVRVADEFEAHRVAERNALPYRYCEDVESPIASTTAPAPHR